MIEKEIVKNTFPICRTYFVGKEAAKNRRKDLRIDERRRKGRKNSTAVKSERRQKGRSLSAVFGGCEELLEDTKWIVN